MGGRAWAGRSSMVSTHHGKGSKEENVIEIDHLSRTFDGVKALAELSLEVKRGSIFGLLGRNGAGKTTTLKILSTILRPTRGAARIDGFDVVEQALKVRSIIGVIGEGTETTRPLWTATEYLRFFLGLHGFDRQTADRKGAKWLDELGLGTHTNRPIGDFSGGMKKRLELSRVFSQAPRVLLLDEPTKELDMPGKREIWEILRSLSKKEGLTVFLCSHDAAEITALCDSLAILREGTCSFLGSIGSLPSNVFRIESDSYDAVIHILGRTLPVLSHSLAGKFLYAAFEDGMTEGELENSLRTDRILKADVRAVHDFDERVLAYL